MRDMVECKQGKDMFASQKKSAIIEILDNQKIYEEFGVWKEI